MSLEPQDLDHSTDIEHLFLSLMAKITISISPKVPDVMVFSKEVLGEEQNVIKFWTLSIEKLN